MPVCTAGGRHTHNSNVAGAFNVKGKHPTEGRTSFRIKGTGTTKFQSVGVGILYVLIGDGFSVRLNVYIFAVWPIDGQSVYYFDFNDAGRSYFSCYANCFQKRSITDVPCGELRT